MCDIFMDSASKVLQCVHDEGLLKKFTQISNHQTQLSPYQARPGGG